MDWFVRKLCIAWSELILLIWLQTSVFRCFVRRKNPTYLRGYVFCFHAWPLFWCHTTYPFTQVSVQFSSVTQSCSTLCNPKDFSTPGLPVHHQLPEFIQIHVHWISDAIQPSHPLSSPSPTFNLSQYQGLFKWVSSTYQVAKVLEFQLQHQSFQWTPRTDFL